MQLRKLRRILRSFDVLEDSTRGKGSHTMFYKDIDGRRFSYVVSTSRKDVADCYVRGARRKFNLTPEDGVTDEEFYDRA